jgi:hypothetical protein
MIVRRVDFDRFRNKVSGPVLVAEELQLDLMKCQASGRTSKQTHNRQCAGVLTDENHSRRWALTASWPTRCANSFSFNTTTEQQRTSSQTKKHLVQKRVYIERLLFSNNGCAVTTRHHQQQRTSDRKHKTYKISFRRSRLTSSPCPSSLFAVHRLCQSPSPTNRRPDHGIFFSSVCVLRRRPGLACSAASDRPPACDSSAVCGQ